MMQNTETYDRLAESMMEVSYRRAPLDLNLIIYEYIVELSQNNNIIFFWCYDRSAKTTWKIYFASKIQVENTFKH